MECFTADISRFNCTKVCGEENLSYDVKKSKIV